MISCTNLNLNYNQDLELDKRLELDLESIMSSLRMDFEKEGISFQNWLRLKDFGLEWICKKKGCKDLYFQILQFTGRGGGGFLTKSVKFHIFYKKEWISLRMDLYLKSNFELCNLQGGGWWTFNWGLKLEPFYLLWKVLGDGGWCMIIASA